MSEHRPTGAIPDGEAPAPSREQGEPPVEDDPGGTGRAADGEGHDDQPAVVGALGTEGREELDDVIVKLFGW